MRNKILVVAPHPDDETLGCGGTLLRHKTKKDQIFLLTITNIFQKNGWSKEKILSRQKEMAKVETMYGFEKSFNLGYPTAQLELVPFGDLISSISKVIGEVKPQIIYLPNRSDIHTDHQIAFNAALSCTKNFRYPFIERILMYEVLSETEFAPALPESVFFPNVFIDVSLYFEKKLKIMGVYKSEIMKTPLPRCRESIRALAQLRGSRIGKKYAEAFMLVQEIL